MFSTGDEGGNKKLFKRILKEVAKQFCLNTSLHGYRLIVLPRRILLERIIWAAICFSSLTTAVALLFMAWFNFQQNPTVLLTDSNHYPIWLYSFPAVTICEYNKISRKKAYEFTKNLTTKDHVETVVPELKLLVQLVARTKPKNSFEEFRHLQDLLDDRGLSVDSVLRKLSSPCDDMLVRCLWKGEEKRCDSIFEQIKTSEGYCCAFNYFALKKHIFSGTLAMRAPKTPRRVSACGYETGLEVVINNDSEDYLAAFIPSVGHKIIIHNPYTYPDWSLQSIMQPQKIVNMISINPTKTYSSNNIKYMSVEKRNCMFPNERNLLYFSEYNFHNCMVECRMNLTKKMCDCLPFNYFHKGVKHGGRICDLRDIPCLSTNSDLITSSIPGFEFSSGENPNYEALIQNSKCKCLPDCENTEYIAEIATARLSGGFYKNKPELYGGVELSNHSILRVFFSDLVGIKHRRDVKFNWQTLLAYYGGLLGLFLGFSFVSGVEIIYFFSIRLIAKATREKKNKKNAASQLQSSLDPNRVMIHGDHVASTAERLSYDIQIFD